MRITTKQNKPPAFQFYPKDWLTDEKVIMMSKEERGDYIDLLCLDWLNEGLDIKMLAKSSDLVRSCFEQRGERVFNKRLDKERKRYKEFSEKKRLAGIQSGKVRSEAKKTLNTCSTHAEQNTNSSSSISSSSSLNNITNKKDLGLSPLSSSTTENNELPEIPPPPPPEPPKAKPKKNKNNETCEQGSIYKNIFDYWMKQPGLMRHRECTGSLLSALKEHINARIKEGYSEQDFIEAITNYNAIIQSPNHIFTYQWSIPIFFERKNGFPRFLNENKPFDVFRNKGAITKDEERQLRSRELYEKIKMESEGQQNEQF